MKWGITGSGGAAGGPPISIKQIQGCSRPWLRESINFGQENMYQLAPGLGAARLALAIARPKIGKSCRNGTRMVAKV